MPRPSVAPRKRAPRIGTLPILLLLPVVVCIAIFYAGPILFAVVQSLQKGGAAMGDTGFAGATHYLSLFGDPRFHSSAFITLTFTVGVVVATYAVGLGLALLLNKGFPGQRAVGGLLIIPWTMPLVVVAVVWGWLLDYQFGIINYLLERWGIIEKPIGWLTDPDMALWSVGAANVWRLFPLAMVTLLAALKAIPQERYEAAAVDGASRWQSFLYVTLPSIRNTTVALVLLLAIWAFGRIFTIVFVMAGGGPAGATETLVIQTYLEAFRYFRLERASALGVITLIVSAALTLVYLKVSRAPGEQ
jgi:multiple sugar transport system permease protein